MQIQVLKARFPNSPNILIFSRVKFPPWGVSIDKKFEFDTPPLAAGLFIDILGDSVCCPSWGGILSITVNLQLVFKYSGVVGQICMIFVKVGFLLKFLLNGKSKLRNRLAHAQDLTSGSSWLEVIDLAGEIENVLLASEAIE